MYQMPQQPSGYQNQRSYQTPEQYEPIGNVQSHYQGQLSQPSFGRPTESIVSSPVQHQYVGGSMQHTSPSFGYGMQQQGYANQSSYTSHQPVQSHASSPATAFGNVGPVIAHYGYQANSNISSQPGFYGGANPSQQHYSSNFSQSFNHNNNGYGMTPTHSQTSENPVYQATNAYEQSGPVISRYGYQSAPGNR